MVSDQCQALERDKVFGDSQTLQKLVVREPARDEMVPSVIFESKTVTEFEPDFFIVNVKINFVCPHISVDCTWPPQGQIRI